MKNLIAFILVITLFTSCKKEPITPGNYQTTTPEPAPPIQPTYAGITPTVTTTNTTTNDLVGKKFKIISYDIYGNGGSTSQAINIDTVYFISGNKYKTNFNGDTLTYNFNNTTYGYATFILNSFNPAGGFSLSAIIGYNAFTNINWPLNNQRSVSFNKLPDLLPTNYCFLFKRVL